MPTATTKLERYELLDRIAVGGMAEVFRAKATGAHGFEKMLAIKRILPDLARDPEFEQRFINEAKLAVKLSHANVVQVFDFGRFSGSLFIAMEYVEGLDLAALLKVHRSRNEPIPIPSALYIAIEMARGLDFAHTRNVIHRDVSPSNILLSRAGEVKIADFGIAEAVAKRRHETKNTGRIMGKWRYMSPEQTRAESLTIASDVFAAASVMHEVMTGEKLFGGDEAEAIIANIHSMEIPRASTMRVGLPPRIDAILGRALARDPKVRPSAAEMLRELLEISYESTIVASALGVAEVVGAIVGDQQSDESSDRIGLDDLIRAQLVDSEGRAPTLRRTDIGIPEGEVVTRAVDADGITILEYDDTLAAGPVAIRGGKRDTSPPPLSVEDDPDAATPKGIAATAALVAIEPPARGPVWPWALAIASAAIVAGGGAWWLARAQSDRQIEKLPVVATSVDGGTPSVRKARLILDSDPSGADVLINEELQAGRTPLEVELDPTITYRIEIRADGYESFLEEDLKLTPGQDLKLRPRLRQASIDVRSRPPGATVTLGGTLLGQTPLVRSVAPAQGVELVIAMPNFRTVTRLIDLRTDEPTIIEETLVSSIVYAQVKINIVETEHGGWADVYVSGKRVGRASGQVKLPVGKQRITLKNSSTGVEKRVEIDVEAGRTRVYQFSLAP